jgi:hypothetical protein
MDFEQELKRVADSYKNQGYQVTIRPTPEDLPPFAKDFKVELLARRGTTASLISVKRNLREVVAAAEMSRYAEITAAQPGWRYDFAILEGERPLERELREAQELPNADIDKALAEAEQLLGMGFVRSAMLTAWSCFEAAMRRRLRAAGAAAGWRTLPRSMLTELYSAGDFSPEEFVKLDRLYQLRSEIVHGFGAPDLDAGLLQFLIATARRLLEESQPAKQTA